MGPVLQSVYEYDQLTRQLYQLNAGIKRQRRRARAQQKKVEEHEQELADLVERIQRTQADAAQAELELRAREEQVQKLRVQLNSTRTNKEYSALLREINTFKADGASIEEVALTKMGAVDELKAERESLQAQIEKEKARLAELNQQAEARERELANQISQIEQKRDHSARSLPPTVLALHERVAEGHDGDAMVPVVKPHPKREEYICSGCNMGVTLEMVNTLRSRDEVVTCGTCSRLLYLGESAEVHA